MDIPCPICGHRNHGNRQNCAYCEADIYDSLLVVVATRSLTIAQTSTLMPTPSQPDAPNTEQPIIFYFDHDDVPMVVERTQCYILGRHVDKDNLEVDIDLSYVGALEKGVSRRHLALDASVHPPQVTDLDSYNHSYINGEQLHPQRAYTLDSGDELRLGYLTMRVYYK